MRLDALGDSMLSWKMVRTGCSKSAILKGLLYSPLGFQAG